MIFDQPSFYGSHTAASARVMVSVPEPQTWTISSPIKAVGNDLQTAATCNPCATRAIAVKLCPRCGKNDLIFSRADCAQMGHTRAHLRRQCVRGDSLQPSPQGS